jgi:hypothetical protein
MATRKMTKRPNNGKKKNNSQNTIDCNLPYRVVGPCRPARIDNSNKYNQK